MARKNIEWKSGQEFAEIVIARETRERAAILKPEEDDSPTSSLDRDTYPDKYMCKNCTGIDTIMEKYDWRRIRRVPNPTIFGKNARPQIRESESNGRYYCKNCLAENISVFAIANTI